MTSTYYWTISSGEWYDTGEANSLREIEERLARLNRRRFASPSFELCVHCKFDDEIITIWTCLDSKHGYYRAYGSCKDNCTQNWLVYELNRILKPI